MIQPCCGSSLQQGTKFLAMISMVLSVIGTAIASIILFSFLIGGPKAIPLLDEEEEGGSTLILKFFYVLITSIFNLFLSILLFIGAEQKNLRLCQVWTKVAIVLLIIDIVGTVIAYFMAVASVEDYVINGSGIIYSFYELWVVFAFISEIKEQKDIMLPTYHVG